MLCMELSLDELLSEVEGAMMLDDPTRSSGVGVQTAVAPGTPERSCSHNNKPPSTTVAPLAAVVAHAGSVQCSVARSSFYAVTPTREELTAANKLERQIPAASATTENGSSLLLPPTSNGDEDGSWDDDSDSDHDKVENGVDDLLKVLSAAVEGPTSNINVTGGFNPPSTDRVAATVNKSAATAEKLPPSTTKSSIMVPELLSSNVVGQQEDTTSERLLVANRRRCGTVRLAGAAARRGFAASSMSQCACDHLRCTDCNFEVVYFVGKAWDTAMDYIFLRNNAPDPTKLSARLQPSADTCAYACQCSWENVSEEVSLPPTGRPPWACGGH